MSSKITAALAGITLAALAGAGAIEALKGDSGVELVGIEIKPDGRKEVDIGGVKVMADDVKEEAPIADSKTVAAVNLSESKLGVRPDGGLVAYVEVDGGLVVLDKMPCVRRRKGGAKGSCPRVTFESPVLGEDFGELNRFPASMVGAVALDCEPVPCSVWAGDEQ